MLFTAQATGIEKSQTFVGLFYYERQKVIVSVNVIDSVKFVAVKNLNALRQVRLMSI